MISERPAWDVQKLRISPAEFQGYYVRFLRDIRARYPEGCIVVLTLEELGPAFVMAHAVIVTIRRSEGETRMSPLTLSELERTVCSWYPSSVDRKVFGARSDMC